ncbi:hypothetical protein [Arthrobacter sp. GMC3]|uniref:hypothetical protein n=1 Tax=Arthrobacter sp. GMC3 TaxID=2058894 RepID=UPI000CE4B89C|nr:hypothetical protein [Arthrobacter sp. GMC3]
MTILGWPWRLIFSAGILLIMMALLIRWRWYSRRSQESSLMPEQISSMDLDSLLLALDNMMIMRSQFGESFRGNTGMKKAIGNDQRIVGQIEDTIVLLQNEISKRSPNSPAA